MRARWSLRCPARHILAPAPVSGNETTLDAAATKEALIAAYRTAVGELDGERRVALALRGLSGALATGPGGRRVVLGLGKAATAMARGAVAALGPLEGVVAGSDGESPPPGIALLPGAHPIPDERSETAGRALVGEVERLRPADAVLFLVSGGGSALAAVPASGLTLGEKAKATRALLRCGAPIEEVNAIRKHLSALKGGWLGARVKARKALSLVLSDVGSGALHAVASGPTLPDPTTWADCLEIVKRRDPGLPDAVVARLALGAAGRLVETPKPGEPHLASIEHYAVGEPRALLAAAEVELRRRGFAARSAAEPLAGDVEKIANRIAAWGRAAAPGAAIAHVGEPTVRTPPSAGTGGRMQHLALLLARALTGERVVVLAAGSDGRDGETDHAGAVVDGGTYGRSRETIDRALERFDSAAACAELGLALPRWQTGTNATDLVVVAATQ